MGDNTKIEWARHPVTGKGASWNPILARVIATGKVGYHCEHASPGCIHCYAEAFNMRALPARGTGLPFKPGHRKDVEIFLDAATLVHPLKWRVPRGIFVCSMTDLFGDFVDAVLIWQMFGIMAVCSHHVFMVLTKRSDRMRQIVSHPDFASEVRHCLNSMADVGAITQEQCVSGCAAVSVGPLKNVWLGVSAEDQERFDERWPNLRATPAAIRFLSIEPQIGRVDMCEQLGIWWNQTRKQWIREPGRVRPDLVIIGGESGVNAREFRYSWAESLLEQCRGAGSAAFLKQVGRYPINDLDYREISHLLRLKDPKGGDIDEWPEQLRVRNFPEVA